MPKRNPTREVFTGIRLESSGPTSWLRVGPFSVASVVTEAVWDTSTAGGRLRVEGAMATGSTQVTVITRHLSSARGQKNSTGTATLLVNFVRIISTAGARTAAKGVKLFLGSYSTA